MAEFVPLTAEEWATTEELWRMLRQALSLGGFTARKQLLFGVASCWYCCDALPPEYYPVLNALNRLADRPDLPTLGADEMFISRCFPWSEEDEGTPVAEAHRSVRAAAKAVMDQRLVELLPTGGIYCEGYPGFEADDRVFYAVEGHVFAAAAGDGNGAIAHSRLEADLIRDLLGNPFRPVNFDPTWRTTTAVLLVREMYESRDFGAMLILADALQDAGCENADILAHCRDEHATHVRGCWVGDLVLGKE